MLFFFTDVITYFFLSYIYDFYYLIPKIKAKGKTKQLFYWYFKYIQI